jgi:hypothetical protein
MGDHEDGLIGMPRQDVGEECLDACGERLLRFGVRGSAAVPASPAVELLTKGGLDFRSR